MPAYVPPHLRKKKQKKRQYVPPHLRKKKKEEESAKKKLNENETESIFGTITTIRIDITDSKHSHVKLQKTPGFSKAYLTAKRKQKNPKNLEAPVVFYWIQQEDGTTLDIGLPEDWNPTTADQIKTQKCKLHKIICERKKRGQNDGFQRNRNRRRGFTATRGPNSPRRRHLHAMNNAGAEIMFGSKSERGKKDANEDRFKNSVDFERLNPKWDKYEKFDKTFFFGVYDGHGGQECAEWAENCLHKTIAVNIGRATDLCEPIVKGYLQFDHSFCEYAKKNEISSGSVGVTCIVQGKTLYVANIGDCAAVLCRSGDTILLSDEHNPLDNEEERARVYKDGGTLSCDGRLNGDLAVSRAFGDVVDGKKMAGLTCLPVVKKYFRMKEDEFIILGCDGLFDYVNYKNSVQYVRRCLRKHNDPALAATRLVDYALKLSSYDNVTCTIIAFPHVDQNGKLTIVKPLTSDLHPMPKKDEGKESKPTGPRRKYRWGILGSAIEAIQDEPCTSSSASIIDDFHSTTQRNSTLNEGFH